MRNAGWNAIRGTGTLVLALALVGVALASTTGAGGYDAARVLDSDDAALVTNFDPVSLTPGASGWSGLAVDSNGEMFVNVGTSDPAPPILRHDEIVAFVLGENGVQDVRLVRDFLTLEEAPRGMVIVPADTFDAGGAPILKKDHLLVLVDGWDALTAASWREVWQMDPSTGQETVLYHKSPEPTRAEASVLGRVAFAADAQGRFFLQHEGSGTGVENSITALEWSEALGTYVERGSAVTTAGSTGGPIAMGSDGFLYTFGLIDADPTVSVTDRILRVDPDATDVWTIFADLDVPRKSDGFWTDAKSLVFDSNGDLWSTTTYTKKGTTRWAVVPVVQNRTLSKDERISESTNRITMGMLSSGPAGQIYISEQESGVDSIVELAPGSGEPGGGGPGGGGNGGGKGKPKK